MQHYHNPEILRQLRPKLFRVVIRFAKSSPINVLSTEVANYFVSPFFSITSSIIPFYILGLSIKHTIPMFSVCDYFFCLGIELSVLSSEIPIIKIRFLKSETYLNLRNPSTLFLSLYMALILLIILIKVV